jgi:hypothetical protein
MQRDTLTEDECAEAIADAMDTIRPGPRRYEPFEVDTLISKLILASTARCPDDDAWLDTLVAPDVIRLHCPHCGAVAEWRAP